MKQFASVNDERLVAARLTVANVGPWVCDVDFEGESKLAGLVALKLGSLALRGTIVAVQSGTHGLQTRARIIAGAGGWGREVPAKHYHNDAGVSARLVADDAARAVGERIGDFVPASERVGKDYARQVGPASRTLEDVVGPGVPWFVDFDGVTQVKLRPASPLAEAAYTVVAYDPRDRVATLAVDDPAKLQIGSVISKGLPGEHTIRAYEVSVAESELRIQAWCDGPEGGPSHLAGIFRSLVSRCTDGELFGHYRYRLVRMASGRVELQAVRAVVGLPDLLPISVWPGVAGTHAELTPGTEVLVVFLEGDRAQPVVVAHAGVDGPGFVPVSLTLGGKAGAPVARQGDVVEVQLPPAMFIGEIGDPPVPFTGPASSPLTFIGQIVGGSSKVRVSS